MKLAEALPNRSSLQKDLAWIKDQFSKISRVPEGSKPPEDPEEMLSRMESRATEFEKLVAAINRSNLSIQPSTMWLAIQHGFYSIVEKSPGEYHMRARCRKDLENLVDLTGLDDSFQRSKTNFDQQLLRGL